MWTIGNVNCITMEKKYGCFSKNLKIELPYDPAILSLGIYLKTWKQYSKWVPAFVFIAVLFMIAHIEKLSM